MIQSVTTRVFFCLPGFFKSGRVASDPLGLSQVPVGKTKEEAYRGQEEPMEQRLIKEADLVEEKKPLPKEQKKDTFL